MEETIINVNTLPDVISRLMTVEKVKVYVEKGIVTLIPIEATTPISDSLLGLIKGSGIGSAEDIKKMRLM